MGNKLTKSTDNQQDQLQINGQEFPESLSKTSTLPASFRRKTHISKTGSLPRNSGGLDKTFDRNTSFGQRFRKSCRNWARQKGLVSSNKENGKAPTESKIKDESKTEDTPPHVDQTEEPVTEQEKQSENDIGSIVASLVVEAHKKKMASRAQSRAQSREMLQVEEPLNTEEMEVPSIEKDETSEKGPEESNENRSECQDSELIVNADDNADKYDSDSVQNEQENEDLVHKKCSEEEKSEKEEEDIVEASSDPTPSANEQLADEKDHHESPESAPEPDHVERNQTEVETGDCNELIDVSGSDSEGLCMAATETVSRTSEEEGEEEEEEKEEKEQEQEQEHKKEQEEQEKKENVEEEEKNVEEEEKEDVSDSSEESESMSTEKQMGQIISDIVENVTCDTLEERDAVTGKLER